MRFYTASLEKFKIQCNSIVLVFRPRQFTQVPDDLANFVMEQVKYRGVFSVPSDIAEDSPEFEKRKRDSLLQYLGITLRERIVNYYAMQDDYKRRGVTLLPDAAFQRALRWEKELREMLQSQAPIEEELSFLEAKRVENTQAPKMEEPSFVPKEEAKTPDSFVELPKKRRGRPAKIQPEVS